jgi:hypothetical protein
LVAGWGGGGTGGLSAAATLREIASAVAMLGSRKPQERAAGAFALARIAACEVGDRSNRKLVEFQEAVVAARGIPLIVRALGAADAADHAACVVSMLAAYNSACTAAIVAAGGIPRRIALLASPSVGVQDYAAGALTFLSNHVENKVAIASAGGIPPLIAFLASTSVRVQENAAGALRNLSINDENRVKIASAGIPRLIAHLRRAACRRMLRPHWPT